MGDSHLHGTGQQTCHQTKERWLETTANGLNSNVQNAIPPIFEPGVVCGRYSDKGMIRLYAIRESAEPRARSLASVARDGR
jgi:hypothetical protein